jgi:uncharacterized membrane protein YjjB (DUF3815 family)
LVSLVCASIGILLGGPNPLNSLAAYIECFSLAICKSQGFMLIYGLLAARCMTLTQLLANSLVGASPALATTLGAMLTGL